jgi:hypothetical protein
MYEFSDETVFRILKEEQYLSFSSAYEKFKRLRLVAIQKCPKQDLRRPIGRFGDYETRGWDCVHYQIAARGSATTNGEADLLS